MKQFLGAAALAAAAALTVPAAASAHPSVYESTGKTYTSGSLNTITRYVVINHGHTVLYTESNGRTGATGVVAFNLVPGGGYRDTKDTADILAEGATGVQAHATCIGGTAQLDSLAKIAGWQGGVQPAPTTQQPFWNYVPFQTTSASLDDHPDEWIPTLLAAGFTTADFASVESARAACVAKGGAYYAADTIQTSAAALAEGQRKPLEERIQGLEGDNAALTAANEKLTGDGAAATGANAALTARVSALEADLVAANGRISSLLLSATPIKLAVGSASAKTVAKSGQTVGVTAAPLQAVTVTISVSERQARKLKLTSSVLGKRTVTTAADGTASVKVKVNKAAAKALGSLKSSLSTTVEATSGDRFAKTTSKLARR